MTWVLLHVAQAGLGQREDNADMMGLVCRLINIFIYEKYMNNIWSKLNKFLRLEKARIK